MQTIHNTSGGDKPSTDLPLSVIRNPLLSFAERGLYTFLMVKINEGQTVTVLSIHQSMGMERGTVSNLLAELKSQGIQGHLPGITGYSEAEKFNAEKIKEKALSWGDKTCDWCGCWCHCIHSHHYPLPLRMGGSDLVGICGKCHADFHFIERTTKGGQSL